MDFQFDREHTPLDFMVFLTALYFPAEAVIKRGDGWINTEITIPVSPTVGVKLQVYLAHNKDEGFYCFMIFLGNTSWLHAHLFTGDKPELSVVSYTKPTL